MGAETISADLERQAAPAPSPRRPLLAIGVGHALTLDTMLGDHATRTEATGTTREGREREAKEAFESALHDIDPSIPRLVPISTRRLLGRTRKTAGKAAPDDKAAPAGAVVTGAPANAGAPDGGQSANKP